MDEEALIAEFQKHRSDDAFAALVNRHVDLVYATALRQVGDPGLAEEVAQNVFVALARKASSLKNHKTVAGWLYQAALHEAKQSVRSELRRQRREQAAAELGAERLQGDSVWSPLVPLLDEALQGMAESDRTAVLLHCLEGRPFREVGAVLGVGEDAARKRVDRALDALTSFFRTRGFAVPVVTTGVPLFLLATAVAPPSVAAATVSSFTSGASVAAIGVAGSGPAFALSKLMTATQIKVGLVGALVLAGLTTGLVLHNREVSRLRDQISAATGETARLQEENQRLLAARPDEAERKRLADERAELARLRGKVSALQGRAAESRGKGTAALRWPTANDEATSNESSAVEIYRADVQASLEMGQMLGTGGWRVGPDKRMFLFMAMQPDPSGDSQQVLVASHFVEVTDEALAGLAELGGLVTDANKTSAQVVLKAPSAEEMLARLKAQEGVSFTASPRVSLGDGVVGTVSQTEQVTVGGGTQNIGPVIKITPRVYGDGRPVDLEVEAELTALVPPSGS